MQHNGVIQNQARTDFRLDVEAALQALLTLSSGPNPPVPADSWPYQLYVDSDDNVLYIRHPTDNTLWMRLGKTTELNLGLLERIPARVDVASVGGVVTLAGATDFYLVSGVENLTAIAFGVSDPQYRRITIKWASARTLVHGVSLRLAGGVNRSVAALSISQFLFEGSGVFSEVGYTAY